MNKILRDLAAQFKKSEVFHVADEIGVVFHDDTPVIGLVKTILENMDTEGIPEPDECSELMFEFLVAAEFIDEDGNILEEEVQTESETESVEEDQLPECFTFEDDRDPSCKKCKVREACKVERINHRPECFGLLYDEHAEECKACLEASFCKQVVQSIGS